LYHFVAVFNNLVPLVSLLPIPWSERDGKKRDPGNEVEFLTAHTPKGTL